MKRRILTALILSLAILMGMTAGCVKTENNKTEETKSGNNGTEEKIRETDEETDESKPAGTDMDLVKEFDDKDGKQCYWYDITGQDYRCVKSVEIRLSAYDEFDINAFEDDNSDWVPGTIGVSVDIYWMPEDYYPYMSGNYPSADKVTMAIYYDENELMGVPEENLLLLYCIYDSFGCSVVEDAVYDLENDRVLADVSDKEGIYMLVDAYEWYQSQGIDASEYAYELPDEYKNMSEWESKKYTGSIMELVDHDYIEENAPVFHVYTTEQLASVVYYANTTESETYVEVYLEDDIDLTGYEWVPMGWDSTYEFDGIIDGQGHTIKGLTIHCERDDCGFVGYSTDLTIKDIYFTDADVTGLWLTGICAGQVIGNGLWENVHAEGNINTGIDSKEGGLVGWSTDLRFRNCYADYTLNGEDEVFHYLSYKERRTEEIGITPTFNIVVNKDKSLSRDEHEGFQNLIWHIELDGETILEYRCDGTKLELDDYNWGSGTYKIYLEAFVEDIYIRVSNIVTVDLN